MPLIVGFILGICFTLVVMGILGAHLENKDRTDNKAVRDAIKDVELIGSIKYRFAKVTEITERQMQLISNTERPSASAAHSRHKNSIMGELKALEQEKIEIFKSILSDGVDPQLSIVVDGQPQNMKMSEAVALFEGGTVASDPPRKTEPKSPKNGLRLVHNKENKNESGSPTVPGT